MTISLWLKNMRKMRENAKKVQKTTQIRVSRANHSRRFELIRGPVEKTNPIPDVTGVSAHKAKDCHGPPGLAMTNDALRVLGALWRLAKQSQFSEWRMSTSCY
jgi:hypothetical protein